MLSRTKSSDRNTDFSIIRDEKAVVFSAQQNAELLEQSILKEIKENEIFKNLSTTYILLQALAVGMDYLL